MWYSAATPGFNNSKFGVYHSRLLLSIALRVDFTEQPRVFHVSNYTQGFGKVILELWKMSQNSMNSLQFNM